MVSEFEGLAVSLTWSELWSDGKLLAEARNRTER